MAYASFTLRVVREPVTGVEAGAGVVAADSDGSLAERAAAGDPAAFRAIFERHGRSVRRYLGDLFRDTTAADEATQETFVRAHRQLGSLRTTDRLVSWLLGIARNVYFEGRRAERRRARDPVGTVDPAGEEETVPAPVDPAPSPEALLLGREADRLLEQAMSGLGDERRAALMLSIDHGLRYEEIATHMGWPLHKVKNEIHRARQTLRARLASYLGETT
jgi:RNA polymerase sigma-70 factor (ECF subfamily)